MVTSPRSSFSRGGNVVKLRVVLWVAALLIMLPAFAGSGPLADYGDAPDNGASFPSLFNTTNSRVVGRRGPYHVDVSMEWLGPWPTSTTTVEDDALLIDQDFDDTFVELYLAATSIPRLGWLKIQISTETGTADTARYLNVLVDQNRDLEWRETTLPEWVVENQPIQWIPMCGYYLTPFLLPAPMFDQILPLDSTWIRLTLTQVPIDPFDFIGVGGWDGSGPDAGFDHGETEDWYLMPIPLITPPPESLPPTPPDSIIIPPPPPDSTKAVTLPGFGKPRIVMVPRNGQAGGLICAKNPGHHPVHVVFGMWSPKWEEHYADPKTPPVDSTMIDPGETVCWPYTVTWLMQPPPRWKEPWDFTLAVDPANDTIFIDQYYMFEEHGDFSTWTDPDQPFEVVCESLLTFDVWASHLDVDSIVDLWPDSLPAGASFSPVGGSNTVSSEFSWTPDYCDAGLHQAVFTAATATDTITETVDINVVKLDRIPVIAGLPDTVNTGVGDTLNIDVLASDEDVVDCGDDMMLLSYSMTPTPTTAPTFVDSGSGMGYFSWTPAAADTGIFTAKFLVQDLYYWGSGEFVTIIVGPTGIGGARGMLRPPLFELRQNSPNPFSGVTTIALTVDDRFLSEGESATLKIYDVSGRLVRDLWTGGGSMTVSWDGRSDDGTKATSGVYFYTLATRSKVLTKKMLFMR